MAIDTCDTRWRSEAADDCVGFGDAAGGEVTKGALVFETSRPTGIARRMT